MRSQELFDRAKAVIPGGVNSPVRAFGSVGMTPRFISRAHGDRIQDVEGNEYIDYIGSWGPMILGHAHPAMLDSGVYLSPSRFEAMFLSTAHTEADLQRTLDAVREFVR